MNTQILTQNDDGQPVVWELPKRTSAATAGSIVCTFLDTATTSMGRATHYNSREEQQAKELAAHEGLLKFDRDLYAILLVLNGVTNRSVQIGTKNLLSTKRNGETLLTPDMEQRIVYHMLQNLPAAAMLRTLTAFRVGDEKLGIRKQNNMRSKKLILRTLLGSPKLVLWSVKYRSKMRAALTHAWGQNLTGTLKLILAKYLDGAPMSERTAKESAIIRRNIVKHGPVKNVQHMCESVAYILGVKVADSWLNPMFKAVVAARTDLKAGKKLPLEVLEGIRSRYHSKTSQSEVLKLTEKTLTTHQRKAVQKSAEKAGVKVDMDPMSYNSVELYLYAFEQGLSTEISEALVEKAEKSAKSFPLHYQKVAVLVDASQSMWGNKTQKLRPMAATLALRDMLERTGEESSVRYCGGTFNVNDYTDLKTETYLCRPQGATDLATGLVELLEGSPDAVFILSDGYENAPSGRVSEVVEALVEIGISTPIFHLNPVFSAESTSGGVRQLSDKIATLPVQRPEGLGLSFLRDTLASDPVGGINAILNISLRALPTIGGRK